MTGFVPKEKLTAYQRWEVAAFDEAQQAAESRPPTPAAPDVDEAAEQNHSMALPTATEIERIHDQAHDQGYNAGYQEGLAQAQARAEEIDVLMTGLQQALAEIDQKVADGLLATAVEIAQQVVRQSLAIRPELLLPVVREAITTLHPHQGHPTLFAHPEDAVLIRDHLADQLAHNNWRILDDASLSRGGCRVELAASEVDATLETRWRRAIESIGLNQEWLDSKP